ncbi:MAG TPA: right-handed parallel beta-helix repeat-containing protein [Allosphingosinicella sp.]|jgi:hypothetical protein
MNYARKSLIAAIGLSIATPAFAQATRTWVSGTGSDANPCSRTAPCQTFSGAFSKTATSGEINAIDPGGFGTMNINKSITVDGLGPMSSILAANTNGIIINGAGAVVNIRNVTINGAGTTTGNGIRILNAAAVNIDNVTFENFGGTLTNGRAITIETASDVRVNISNSRITNATNFGIHSNPSAGTVNLVVQDTVIDNGGTTAIQLRQNTNARINRVTVSRHGVNAAAVTAELTTVNTHITDSVFVDNAFGIFNGNGGSPVTRIAGTTITGSTSAALQITGGQIISYGNNPIRGNVGNELPSSVELPR